MDVESNVEKLRTAFAMWDACKGSDLTMWNQYTTEDICMRSLGDGHHGLDFSCLRRGQGQMREYLGDLTDAFEMQHWTLLETIAQGDKVVGIGSTAWVHKATKKRAETRVVVICRFRKGLVCEYEEYFDTAAVAAATR